MQSAGAGGGGSAALVAVDPGGCQALAASFERAAEEATERRSRISAILAEGGESAPLMERRLDEIARWCTDLAADIRWRVDTLVALDESADFGAGSMVSGRLPDTREELIELLGQARDAAERGDPSAAEIARSVIGTTLTAEKASSILEAAIRNTRSTAHGTRLATLAGRLGILQRRPPADYAKLTRQMTGPDGARMPRAQRRQLAKQLANQFDRELRADIRHTRAGVDDARSALRTNRPLTNMAARARARVPPNLAQRAGQLAKGGGRVLGGVGIAASLYDTVGDVQSGDALGVASNAANIAGTAMLLSGVGTPVAAVLIGGSLIYEHREQIVDAAQWTGDKLGDAAEAVGGWLGF